MKAEVLTIGDELLRGEIVDTNKSFLSDRLLRLDVQTLFQVSVRDDAEDMIDAFRRAASRSDLVLVSGGLGPTRDDITAAVIARAFDRELVFDEAALDEIRGYFERVGREMTENNRAQAYFPAGADQLPNPVGTAAGFALAVGDTTFFCLPGVPGELKRMMDEQVLPRIERRLGSSGEIVRARLLRTFGLGEAALDDALKDIAASGDVTLGFRTSFPDNLLRPVARAADASEADAKLAHVCAAIRDRLGPMLYGEGDETLERVVVRLLREHGKTLAVAESCTGGLIASRITAVPGASHALLGGVVAYANSAKQALLDVPEATLARHGAVSEPVARTMAERARERFGADLGVATTGISGPDGGTPEKPVGQVCIALADGARTHVETFVFTTDRARHRMLTAQIALDWARRALIGAELVGPGLLRGGEPARTRGQDS